MALWKNRNISIVILCGIYLSIYLCFMENAEFILDDGVWTYAAVDIIEHHTPFIGFENSRGGMPHSPLGAYIHALFYFIYPSISSVVLGVLLSNILAHVIIIKLGELLGNRLWGYCSSLLFFFSPPFFVLLSYRTWQLPYIPFFCSAMLYCLVKFCSPGGHWLYVPACFFMWAGCFNLHPSAILMLPIPFVILCLSKNFKTLTPLQYIISCLSLLLGPFHFMQYLYTKGVLHYMLVPCFVLLLFCYICRKSAGFRLHTLHSATFEKYVLWLFLIFAAAGVCICLKVYPEIALFGMFYKFLEMLPSNNQWVAEYIGFNPHQSLWNIFLSRVISIEVFLWCFYMVRNLVKYETLTMGEKIIFYANLIPALLFFFTPLALRESNWDLCWPYMIFFFPVPFLAIMKSITTALPTQNKKSSLLKTLQYCALFVIISSNSFVSVYLSSYVFRTGGIAMHFANLGIKRQVLEYIYQIEGDPEIIIAQHGVNRLLAALVLGGWNMVGNEVQKKYSENNLEALKDKASVAASKKYYYIFETKGAFLEVTQELAASLAADSKVTRKQFKSVMLYCSNDYKENIGKRLSYNYSISCPAKFRYVSHQQ